MHIMRYNGRRVAQDVILGAEPFWPNRFDIFSITKEIVNSSCFRKYSTRYELRHLIV